MATDPKDFIRRVWAVQKTDGTAWGFTSKKDWTTGAWVDYPSQDLSGFDIGDGRDLYFAPCLFSADRRLRDNALPSRWLYADLDEVDPAELPAGLVPSLAWETSPGRYQGLWLLDKPLALDRFERLNQRLTYGIGADRGGWSATKVLRVPGSISTKYGSSRAKRHEVVLVGKGHKFSAAALQALLPPLSRGKKPGIGGLFQLEERELPARKDVIAEWRGRLPARSKRLLATKVLPPGSDRSGRLWEMYNELLQAGLAPAEVLVLVRGSVWNKYAGQRRELEQLQREIQKAAEKVMAGAGGEGREEDAARLVGAAQAGPTGRVLRLAKGGARKKPKGRGAKKAAQRAEEDKDVLPYMTADEFMFTEFPKPEWLVEGIWAKGAYGVCAGEYKSFKTTILLNLALSVSSGRNFLENEHLRVMDKGRVLYLHEEGRQGGIQDRLHRMMVRKGLGAQITPEGVIIPPKDLPLDISSKSGFKLSDSHSQMQLVNYLSLRKPKLVIMEAWYLIASELNENNAGEVAPVLGWLAKVSQDFGCAVIISHHYNKGRDEKDGPKRRAVDRISGSGVFGRWYESVILLERKGDEDDYTAAIEAHHREQKGIGKQTIRIEIDAEDEDDFNVSFVDDDITEREKMKPQVALPVVDTVVREQERRAVEWVEKQMVSKKSLGLSVAAERGAVDEERLGHLVVEAGYRVSDGRIRKGRVV